MTHCFSQSFVESPSLHGLTVAILEPIHALIDYNQYTFGWSCGESLSLSFATAPLPTLYLPDARTTIPHARTVYLKRPQQLQQKKHAKTNFTSSFPDCEAILPVGRRWRLRHLRTVVKEQFNKGAMACEYCCAVNSPAGRKPSEQLDFISYFSRCDRELTLFFSFVFTWNNSHCQYQ